MTIYKLHRKHFIAKKYNQYDKKNKVRSSYRNPNNKLNPPKNKGQVSRCNMCDSKMHWGNNCSHNIQSVPLDETHLDVVRTLIH